MTVLAEAFDRLAKRLADGDSRRGLLAGLLLGFGGRAGADEEVAERCRRYCRSCGSSAGNATAAPAAI
jgi:hypothetical protein